MSTTRESSDLPSPLLFSPSNNGKRTKKRKSMSLSPGPTKRLPLSPIGINYHRGDRRIKDSNVTTDNSNNTNSHTKKRKHDAGIFSPKRFREESHSQVQPQAQDENTNNSIDSYPQGDRDYRSKQLIVYNSDTYDEDTTKDSSRFISLVTNANQQQVKPYRKFEFDLTKSLSTPHHRVIRKAYKYAIRRVQSLIDETPNSTSELPNSNNVPNTASIIGRHQLYLQMSACPLLSLDEVILPSIMKEHSQTLKKLQGKAQGHNDIEAKDQLSYCRAAIKAIEQDAISMIQISRSEYYHQKRVNEQAIREERFKMKQAQKEERRKQRVMEQEEKKRMKKLEKQRRRREKKKNLPRNKELWREVALLMTDLAKLEKEEKMWKDADEVIQRLELNSNDIENLVVTHFDGNSDGNKEESNIGMKEGGEDQNIQSVVDDMTLSADRINHTFTDISSLISEVDVVRDTLFETYRKDHKVHGYLGAKNPKALLRAFGLGKTAHY